MFSLFISSCSINIGNSELGISESTQSNFNTVTSFLTNNNSTVEIDDNYQENNGEFKIISNINNSYTVENKIYTIINEGDFTISGTLENGQIKVLAPSKKVNIYLSGVTMASTEDALIYVEDADKVNIKAVEGTYNELNDNRPLQDSSVDDETGNAAIYTKADTDLEGKGTLVVNATYNNGIHTKNDLNIKNLSLKVNAVNNAIKANDSLTIESGNIIAISKSGNGLKTSNSDISSKGNQRGTITITGGNIDIYSALDAIDAAYNVVIDDIKSPMLNIYTDKYSSYTGDAVDKNSSFIYLRIKNSLYSSSYRYAASFYNSIDDHVWEDAVYFELQQSNRNIYYVYKVNVPSGYTNVQFYKFDKDQKENSFDSYISKSEGGVVIAKGGSSSGMASALDIDSTMTITGGTFIAAGSICTTPSSNSTVNYILFGSVSSMGGMGGPGGWGGSSSSGNYSFSEGTYSISNTDITFTLTHQCSNMFICSEDLLLNNSYTISNGSSSYTWIQSSNSVTYNN